MLYRVWVTPCPESSDDCVTLGVREFTPDVLDAKALENFDLKALLRKTNSKIWESPLSGEWVEQIIEKLLLIAN